MNKRFVAAIFTSLLLFSCSDEPGPQTEVARILGIEDEAQFQATSHGFPDRYYHARLNKTAAEFNDILKRLNLSADPTIDLRWPTATGQPEWWATNSRNLKIYSNSVRADDANISDKIIKVGFDQKTSDMFVQISYEF